MTVMQRTSAALDWYRARVEATPMSLLQLAMRIGVGTVFFKAGLLKYSSFEFAVQLFESEYKVPLIDPTIAARLAMTQELVVPVFLFLGLGTRLAVLPLLGMISVIQIFVYPNAWSDHLLWSSVLLFLAKTGAGPFSLDALLSRRFERRRP